MITKAFIYKGHNIYITGIIQNAKIIWKMDAGLYKHMGYTTAQLAYDKAVEVIDLHDAALMAAQSEIDNIKEK